MWLLLKKNTASTEISQHTMRTSKHTCTHVCTHTQTQFIISSSFLSSKNRLILNNILTKAFFVFLNVKGLRVYFVYEFADV